MVVILWAILSGKSKVRYRELTKIIAAKRFSEPRRHDEIKEAFQRAASPNFHQKIIKSILEIWNGIEFCLFDKGIHDRRGNGGVDETTCHEEIVASRARTTKTTIT